MKMLHPFIPFITEEIFQELYHNNSSIHLTEIKPLKFNFEEELKYGNMICDIIPYLLIGIVGLVKVNFLIKLFSSASASISVLVIM